MIARIRFVLLYVLVLVGAIAAAACDDSPTSPSVNVPFSTTDLQVGTGTLATNGRNVSVHYTGWLYETNAPDNKGTQFDSSVGRNPLQFLLGAGQVIAGFDQGVVGMRVGGLRRIVVPPSLGYGAAGSGPVPPNATLVFEVQLLDVQ